MFGESRSVWSPQSWSETWPNVYALNVGLMTENRALRQQLEALNG